MKDINIAIINGAEVHLDSETSKAASNFHANRKAFAWVNGLLTFNENEGDVRDHQHWLCEDYGLSLDEYEETPRGYIKKNRIQLFIGSSFSRLNIEEVEDDFETLINRHEEIFNERKCTIFNGVHIGKIGEIWEPIETVKVIE